MKPAAMAETLIPASAWVDSHGDVRESAMMPDEVRVIATAVSERRREFATVRYCARRALQQIGAPAGAILPDADGAPQWPPGVVGSMTHCAGYRAAVVARSDGLRGIGIDAEVHAPMPGPAGELVLRTEEQDQADTLTAYRPGVHWERIVFSAKEAVYKACFPSTRRWLDFADISVDIRPDGRFHACAERTHDLEGRWTIDGGLVMTVASVAA
jgi:4'-phosphopantetheinyl transferase EntD